ncbi:hypothetical protein ACFE04_005026 [Oxalis oulophora]
MITGVVCGGIRASCCLHFPQKPTLLRSFSSRRRSHRLCSTKCFIETKKDKQKVLVISGPTGAGKTRLALELAKRLNGEIISADSVQVYKGLDIGSAKPNRSEQSEVPHHLIDILRPSEDYSVGRFYEDAKEATQSIIDRGRVPIVTGGTGLYLRWYIYGKPDVPKATAEIAAEVNSELAKLERDDDWDAAVQLVVNAGDPKAKLVAVNDCFFPIAQSMCSVAVDINLQKCFLKATGSPPSAFQIPYDSFKKQNTSTENSFESTSSAVMTENQPKDLEYDFNCYFLSSPRVDLYKSIDFRCEDMLIGNDGILSEAKELLDAGLLPNSNSATRAIGYRQAMDYLLRCREQDGRSSAGDFFSFLSDFQKASRNFAKRQLTWFRNEQIYHWLDASKPMDNVLNFISDAYHDQSGKLTVPESLMMRRDSSRRETLDLKGYRTRNSLQTLYPFALWPGEHDTARDICNTSANFWHFGLLKELSA